MSSNSMPVALLWMERQLAQLHFQQQQWAQAASYLTTIIEHEPTNITAYGARADCYLALWAPTQEIEYLKLAYDDTNAVFSFSDSFSQGLSFSVKLRMPPSRAPRIGPWQGATVPYMVLYNFHNA